MRQRIFLAGKSTWKFKLMKRGISFIDELFGGQLTKGYKVLIFFIQLQASRWSFLRQIIKIRPEVIVEWRKDEFLTGFEIFLSESGLNILIVIILRSKITSSIELDPWRHVPFLLLWVSFTRRVELTLLLPIICLFCQLSRWKLYFLITGIAILVSDRRFRNFLAFSDHNRSRSFHFTWYSLPLI